MYQPSKGGHAPGHLRDAFVELIDGGLPSGTATVAVNDETRPLRWLLGQLWNCTDTLPGTACDDLGISQGASYAQAVRHLAAQSA